MPLLYAGLNTQHQDFLDSSVQSVLLTFDFNFALLSQKLILASDNETGIKLSTELTRVR